ncbi:hypothetical protein Tco_1222577 [Tanacetum coccineum]
MCPKKKELALEKENDQTAQLVPRFHTIGRCNNYAVLQSIPCSPECKIIGQILLDHPLSYALTATVDVPTVYLQQFWRIVSKVPGPEDMIKFILNTQEVGYQGVVNKVSAFYTKNLAQPWQTMFKVFNRCLTTRTSRHDQTKINNLQMFHAVINQTNVDYVALLWWDFMNNANQKKEAIQYPRFITLIIADLMKKLPDIPQMIDEDDHSIKDDTQLEIEKMVEGDEDEESYASEFVDLVLNDDVDDSGTKIEPGRYKENLKNVDNDDDEIEKEKKDEEIEKGKNDDNVEKRMRRHGQIWSHIKNKFITHEIFMSEIREVLNHCNNVVPEMTFAKTNEMIKEEIPCLVNLTVNKDREVDPINAQEMIATEFATHGPKMIDELFQKHMHNTTLNLYPTTSSSTAKKSFADL